MWWIVLAGCAERVKDVAFVPGEIAGTGKVTFETRLDGAARVRWGVVGEDLTHESPAVPAEQGAVPLLGLLTGKKVEMVLVIGDEEAEPIEVLVPPPIRGLPPVRVELADPSRMCDGGSGYVLFSYLAADGSGVAIIDRDGNYVWSVEEPYPRQVGRPRPGRDGKSILWNVADGSRLDDIATVVRSSMDGSTRTETRTLNGHHDFVELPDGRIGWLGYEFGDVDSPDGVDLGPVRMAWDTIYESEEGAAEVGTEETIFDTALHYPPGIHTLPQESVAYRAGVATPAFLKDAYEFGHGNSLGYREGDDRYLMMWRWLDVLIEVDRGSPADPYVRDIGGAFEDPAMAVAPDEAFEHGHFSDVWDGGILVFDNKLRGESSRLVEYALDDEGREQVWEYSSDRYEPILGDARRIPIEGCDNLLVSWSKQARLAELTRDGVEVWSVPSSPDFVMERVYWLPDLYDFSGVAYP